MHIHTDTHTRMGYQNSFGRRNMAWEDQHRKFRDGGFLSLSCSHKAVESGRSWAFFNSFFIRVRKACQTWMFGGNDIGSCYIFIVCM